MRRWLLGAVLALPILGLSASIAVHEIALAGATEWRIPIAGYDPRDPIRGRYIAFIYDWQVAGDTGACFDKRRSCELCLERRGEDMIASVRHSGMRCPNRLDLGSSDIAVQITSLPGASKPRPVFASRIFVSETSAPALEAQMRTRPMAVVARLTRGGRLVNTRLEPRGPAAR